MGDARPVIACRDYIYDALVRTMEDRSSRDGMGWVERERMAVAVAANEWAVAHAPARTVTVDDVEAVEGRAVGHCDYASKLALYVAELVVLEAARSGNPQPAAGAISTPTSARSTDDG